MRKFALAVVLSVVACLPSLARHVVAADGDLANARGASGTPASVESDTTGPDSTGVTYRNPRVYNVRYTFEMKPDGTIIDRSRDLKVWVPVPREWGSQKHVRILSVEPPPHARYDDPEYGNRIYYWDFGRYPERASYRIEIELRLESYAVEAIVDTARVEPYDTTSEEYLLYTRSGHTTDISPRVEELAQIAIGDERNPYLQARRIFEFVGRKIRYRQTMPRGLDYLLATAAVDEDTGEERYLGACDQYSALFVGLSRAVGIPARSVQGFVGWAPQLDESNSRAFSVQDTMVSEEGFAGAEHHGLGPHVWAEFFLPGYGWIPVDPQAGLFGKYFNAKVIMSRGRDVPLGSDAPLADHGGYGFQWVPIHEGRVDLFQSPVWNIGEIRNARVNVYHTKDPFPADALADYLSQVLDGEMELADWRERTLEDIDYVSRALQGKANESFRVFEDVDPNGPYRDLTEVYEAYTLHMLRTLVLGDKESDELVRDYLDVRTQTLQPVPTSRFVEMAEAVHGAPLAWFFEQWTPENGLPHLRLENVRRERQGDSWLVTGRLVQLGRTLFKMPIPIAVETDEGEERHAIWLEHASTDFELESPATPVGLRVDPDHDLLILRKMPQRLSKFWNAYPNIVVLYGTLSEVGANREAAEWYTTRYLGMDAERAKPDTAATRQDLETEVVVLFGRPSTNAVSRRFSDHFNIRFDRETFSHNGAAYAKASQGVAEIVDHPLRARGRLILYAGLSEGAMLALRDLGIYDAPHSYVVYDGATTIAVGDWEGDSDLTRKFE